MKKLIGMLAVVAVAALCASPAMAVVGDRIQIIHNNGDPDGAAEWHLAEVQAFEVGSGVNVAASSNGGSASYLTGASTFGTVPGDAIDGNTNGGFAGGSVWHSAAEGAGSTFQIDLAGITAIETMSIFGRTDCCQSRDDDLTLVIFKNGVEVRRLDFGIPNAGQVANIGLVPEPTSMALLGLAGVGLAARRRRRAAA